MFDDMAGKDLAFRISCKARSGAFFSYLKVAASNDLRWTESGLIEYTRGQSRPRHSNTTNHTRLPK